MKKTMIKTFLAPLTKGLRLLLLLLITVSVAAAQNTTTDNTQARHEQLRELRDTMQNALNQADIDTLLHHVTDDVVFTTMNGDRVIGKTAIRQYFAKMLGGENPVVKSVKTQFTVEDLSHLYGDDTAVAFGHSRDDYQLSNGDMWTVNPQWSTTLVHQNGQWLIANFHYSVNLFDNPILNTQRKWLLGGGAVVALLALLLGFIVGRRRGRKARQN